MWNFTGISRARAYHVRCYMEMKSSFNCRPHGRKKLLSACVSIWTETRKICKAWVLINQIQPRCFCSYGLWLNKSNHRVKQADISKPTDITKSISMNRILSNRSVDFHPGLFCFPIIHYNSIFPTHVKRACYSNMWKAWHLYHTILNLLMVI